MAFLAGGLVVLAACGLIGQLSPTILEGQQFAHTIRFPSRFETPKGVDRMFAFDQYTFRVSRTSPDVLLVAACAYTTLPGHELEPSIRACSPNAFAIDTERGYAVREAKQDEWEHANPITGEKEMRDPYRRNLREEMKKPVDQQPMPIDPTFGHGGDYLGYRYRGNEFLRRGDWIVSLSCGDSEDGKLVVLAGVDKRKFPHQEPGLVDSAVNTGLYGLVTIDVYASDPLRHVAAVDLDSHINVNDARRRVSVVNSRWLAIGLNLDLRDMLLFDFKPLGGAK